MFLHLAWARVPRKPQEKKFLNFDGLKQKGGGRRKEGFSLNSQEVGGSDQTRNRKEPAGFGVGLPLPTRIQGPSAPFIQDHFSKPGSCAHSRQGTA